MGMVDVLLGFLLSVADHLGGRSENGMAVFAVFRPIRPSNHTSSAVGVFILNVLSISFTAPSPALLADPACVVPLLTSFTLLLEDTLNADIYCTGYVLFKRARLLANFCMTHVIMIVSRKIQVSQFGIFSNSVLYAGTGPEQSRI